MIQIIHCDTWNHDAFFSKMLMLTIIIDAKSISAE